MGLRAKNISVMNSWHKRAKGVGVSKLNICQFNQIPTIKDREMKSKIVDSCRKMLRKTMKGDYLWLFLIDWNELEKFESVLKIMRSQIEM